ncbi:unnamed protein product [Prunus armeniaca]
MLNNSRLPHNLCSEALLTANNILDRILHKKTKQSPYEVWKGRIPTYNTLKVWGCLAKVQVPLPKRLKLGPKTIGCVFIESIDADFFGEIFPYKEKKFGSNKRKVHDGNPDEPSFLGVQEKDLEPKRGKRTKTPKSFGPDFVRFLTEEEPQTYKEAMASPEAPLWKEAVNNEIESIMQNHMWELVYLPHDNKPIGFKWIFKRKLKADGTIDKYKAHLVAKGPNLAYSVSKLSRYTSNLGHDHWEALIKVLRYLKYTQDYGLHYTKYPPVLEGYSDANWISDSTKTKSTSGYVFIFGGAAVSWKSSKQTCIARSTRESKFVPLDKVAKEAKWLRNFLEDIPMWPKPVIAICMHCEGSTSKSLKWCIQWKVKTYQA